MTRRDLFVVGLLISTMVLTGCGGAKATSTTALSGTTASSSDLCAQFGGGMGRVGGQGRIVGSGEALAGGVPAGHPPVSVPLDSGTEGVFAGGGGQMPSGGAGGSFDAAGMQEYQELLAQACADGTADAAETAALDAKRQELGLPDPGQLPQRGLRPGQIHN